MGAAALYFFIYVCEMSIPQMPLPAIPGTLLCTDEDIAGLTTEYRDLCDRDNLIAKASDGVIMADDRWSLTSETIDFSQSGVIPGNIIYFTGPKASVGPDPGQAFAVESTLGRALLIRRKGERFQSGSPPFSEKGSMDLLGLFFDILTYKQYIFTSSIIVREALGLNDPGVIGQRLAADDVKLLSTATAAHVLMGRYSARPFTDERRAQSDASKKSHFKEMYETLLGTIHTKLEDSSGIITNQRPMWTTII